MKKEEPRKLATQNDIYAENCRSGMLGKDCGHYLQQIIRMAEVNC